MSAPSSAPARLGGYRLERLLGRGGMGEVFLAWDERLERHVAIKRVLSDPPPGARARARFRREARAVARLSHPAIVQVFELLETEDGDGLVMEYVEGRALPEVIATGGLDLARTLRLAAEMAAGLAEAHGKGLVHRDLKPENVLVTAPAGHAKILDFGLARLLWSEGIDRDSLTCSGALVGTVRAMSPEQASGRSVDHRADLFALGSLLYEMLTGRAPFRGHNVLDTLRRITSEAPTPLAELRPGLAPELIALVESLLVKEPEERPQNARLVADALGRLRTSDEKVPPKKARPAPAAPRSFPREPAPEAGVAELPTGDWPSPLPASGTTETAVRTLLLTDLVDSTRLLESLGDARASEVFARHDRAARDLLARFDGLEIDKTRGFLCLFERPFTAVSFALAYHRRLSELSGELEVELRARASVHLGEVRLHHNAPEDVSRGAKPLEVEGLARPTAALLLSLAGPRQTLLSASAFEVARRAALGEERWGEELRWLAHGDYVFAGLGDPVEVCEVGLADFAPLTAPPDSEQARRTASFSDELVLGWRPAPGQKVPRRPNWVLAERLGEGGFGEVWLAAHASGEKRVFKFCFEAARLRALMREVTLFRLLKEALGHRDDIARVLDWNFDQAPYFLEVEHTEGGDLKTWAERQGGLEAVPVATRVELVAQVADALSAAHSVGVLHKDVKPENVLVTHDVLGRPRVRLTDFGVGALDDRSRLDAQGVPALGFTETWVEEESTAGSRRYLAPELLEGKPATVSADLYSLGVMLYQAVVGDFSRVLAPGWRREVKDDLLAEDIALLVDSSCRQRPVNAASVAERLRSLDERRTECRAARKAARWRRRLRFAAIVGLVLTASTSALLIQAHHARRQAERLQDQAERARAQAEDLVGFLLGDLQMKLRSIGRLDTLESAGLKALEYFEALEAEDRDPRTVVRHARALHQMGDLHMAQGDLAAALALFRRALIQSEALAARSPGDLEVLFELGQSHFWVGSVYWRQRELEGAQEHLTAYLEISRRLLEQEPEKAEWRLEASYGHNNVGDVYLARNNLGLALEHFGHALALGKSLVDLDRARADWRLRLAGAHIKLGRVEYRRGELTRALGQGLEAVKLLSGLVAEDAENTLFQRRLAIALDFAVTMKLSLGDLAGSLAHNRRGLEILQRLHAADPSHQEWQGLLALALARHGQIADYLGRGGEARRHLREALHLSEDALERNREHKRNRYIRAWIWVVEAARLARAGQTAPARRTARQALDLIQRNTEQGEAISSDQQLRVDALLVLGRATASADREESRRLLELARDLLLALPSSSPEDTWRLASVHLDLGELAAARRRVHTLLGFGYRYPPFVERIESLAWPSL